MGCADSKSAAASVLTPSDLKIEEVYGTLQAPGGRGQSGRCIRPDIGFVVKCYVSRGGEAFQKCFVNVLHSSLVPVVALYSNATFEFAMPVTGGAAAATSGTTLLGGGRAAAISQKTVVYVVDVVLNSKVMNECSVNSSYLHETVERIIEYVRNTHALEISANKKYKLPVIAKGFVGHDKLPKMFLSERARADSVSPSVSATHAAAAAAASTPISVAAVASSSGSPSRFPCSGAGSECDDSAAPLKRRDSYTSYQYTPVVVRQMWLVDGADSKGSPAVYLEYRPTSTGVGYVFSKFYMIKYDRSKIYIVGYIASQTVLTKLVLYNDALDTAESELIDIWVRTARARISFSYEDLSALW